MLSAAAGVPARAAERRRGRLRVHVLIDTLATGGAEIVLADLAAAVERNGVSLSVGYLREMAGSPSAQRLRALGIEPQLVGLPRRGLGGHALARVVRHVRRVRPEVLHTHLGYADVLGGLAGRLLGVPVVSTVHGHQWDGDRGERLRVGLQAAVRRHAAARVIAVSDAARSAYLAGGADHDEHVVTIRNAVSPTPVSGDRRALRAALGMGMDDLLVAMVSTLRPEKGHVHAMDAVRRLAPTFPTLRLYVAGEGPSRPAVERAAADLGGRVVIAGFRPDAMTVLGAADVLLQPSLHDALPTTVMEAMAAGCAIVASAVGGIPEMITDGESGVLVAPPVTGWAVAEALAPLLHDEARRNRLGTGARARFERDLSPGTWGRRLSEVYAEVAGR